VTFISFPVANLDVVGVYSDTLSVFLSHEIPFTLVNPAHFLVLFPRFEDAIIRSCWWLKVGGFCGEHETAVLFVAHHGLLEIVALQVFSAL